MKVGMNIFVLIWKMSLNLLLYFTVYNTISSQFTQRPIAIYCPALFCVGDYKILIFNNERTFYDVIFIF